MKNSLGKTLLSKGLPLLANILTGGTAKPVFELIQSVTGFKFEDAQHMEQILQNRPDLIIKLKEFESNQKIELEKLALQEACLQIEETKAYLSDKQNARNRETALTKATAY